MLRLSVILLLFITACSPRLPATAAFDSLPVQTQIDLDAVMQREAVVEVIPLMTGEIRVDRSLLLDIKNPNLEDQKDRKMWVPVLAYLVRHPDHGDFLIDSGFDHHAQSGRLNYGGVARFVTISRQREGEDTISLLKTLDVDPASLTMILVSHLHGDHITGLPSFPGPVKVVAGPDSLKNYEHMWYAPADHLGHIETLYELDFTNASETELGRTLDLFGDGSVLAVHSPGHKPENLSFFIQARGGPVLLAFDTCHTQEGYRSGVAPGRVDDRELADRSLHRLINFARARPDVRFVAGHDPEDWDMTRGVQDPL